MSTALLWDIDGTLLTTARAGVFALEEALAETCRVSFDLRELKSAGLTDAEVAELALRTAGAEPEDGLVDRFLRAYERRLPAALQRRQGHVLPGVREVLDDLAGRSDVRSVLLTGNTPAGARAKLAHYGLERFFPDGAGAFCLGPGARAEIARRALPLVDGAESVYVIGDTPQDIACGRAIGARTIAVATGSYDPGRLAEHDPWRVLERIPEPGRFRELLGLG